MENENKKDRGFRVTVIIALLISVICLSIAYAQYTSILRIQGTGTIKSDAWNIYFTDMDGGTAYNNAELPESNKLAIVDPLSVSGYMGNLAKPGDSIVYNWKVKNGGDINATLSTITRQKLTCTPDETADPKATQAEANSLCDDLKLTLTYDSTVIAESTGSAATGTDVSTDLLASQSKDVQMKLEWNSLSTVSVTGPVEVSIGLYTFSYIQK